jgi:hypothetical protein
LSNWDSYGSNNSYSIACITQVYMATNPADAWIGDSIDASGHESACGMYLQQSWDYYRYAGSYGEHGIYQ